MKKGNEIGYIIVLDQDNDAKRIGEVIYPSRKVPAGVLFTTQQRLVNNPLHQALFMVDENGVPHHYDSKWAGVIKENEETG